jgi:ATP-dependent DNA ligase
MPTHPVYRKGNLIGYRWGHSGKLYKIAKYGKQKARQMSDLQARAIFASGYKGRYSSWPKRTVWKRRRDGYLQRYHLSLGQPKEVKDMKQEGIIAEPKYDGTRMVAYIKDGKTTFINRRNINKTDTYPELADISKHVIGDAVLDGEVVVIDKKHPFGNFELLATRDRLKDKELIKSRSKDIPLKFMAFDVLEHNGQDVRKKPLLERKKILDKLINQADGIKKIEYTNDPSTLLKKIKKSGSEGIIIKKVASPYPSGKTRDWEKYKIKNENDVAITGATEGIGKRKNYFGALKMSVNTKQGLKKVGLVGTGFNNLQLKEISTKLKKGEKLVARVKYRKIGSQGNYIEPSFIALREDINQKQTHA